MPRLLSFKGRASASALALLALLIWNPAPPAQAGGLSDLKKFTTNLDTWSAAFSQTTYDERGLVRERSSGRFYLKRPGMFHWDYRLPYRQQIIGDGDSVWLYDHDLKQVDVRDQEGPFNLLASLLTGSNSRLLSRFDIFEKTPEKDGGGRTAVELRPKKTLAADAEIPFKLVRLDFTHGHLRQVRLVDELEQKLFFAFNRIERNKALPASRFRFQPPAGVDVLDRRRANTGHGKS